MNAPMPHISAGETHGATADFLMTLYGTDAPGFITVCSAPPTLNVKDKADISTHWLPAADPEAAAELALSLARTENVWYGVGLRGEKLPGNQRGKADDVTLLPGFCATSTFPTRSTRTLNTCRKRWTRRSGSSPRWA